MPSQTPPSTSVEPAVGQVYEQSRGDTLLQILYVDELIVLLRSTEPTQNGSPSHRLEKRSHFDELRDTGFFSYAPDAELSVVTTGRESWAEVSYVGKKTEQALYDAGFETVLDVRQADIEQLKEVPGVGSAAATNLKEYAD